MRIRVTPGPAISGTTRVPADKSIAHRWLLLASMARGTSHLGGLGDPMALDVASTADACGALLGRKPGRLGERVRAVGLPDGMAGPDHWTLQVEGVSRRQWWPPGAPLDCGNSGTSMRLLMGVIAASSAGAVLDGDESLRSRPMERVAEPLRRMGAGVETVDGHAPVTVKGARLQGISHRSPVPSAQVKSAILLAGINASGRTEVFEVALTRDHTERALRALGGPVFDIEGGVAVERFEVPGFAGTVPGDVSSAAILAGAAVVTGGEVVLERVGANPTRAAFLRVLERMGVTIQLDSAEEEVGEPVGTLRVALRSALEGTVVAAGELPEVIDEVPLLAVVAAHADGESRFEGAGELRVKESDRLGGVRDLIRGLGGDASVEGDALVVAGGGLRGGSATSNGDHRMAMAAVVATLAAHGPSEIDGVEAAGVSFPGFTAAMLDLGARIEVLG